MHFSNCENCHWTVTYQNIPERDNKLSRPLVSFSSEFCFRFLQAICWCYFTLGEIGLAISRQLCLRRAHKQAFQRWREIHPQRSREVRPTHRSQMDMDFVLSVFFCTQYNITLALKAHFIVQYFPFGYLGFLDKYLSGFGCWKFQMCPKVVQKAKL